jgi:hypothetical protein
MLTRQKQGLVENIMTQYKQQAVSGQPLPGAPAQPTGEHVNFSNYIIANQTRFYERQAPAGQSMSAE